jgi:hypothetical protein
MMTAFVNQLLHRSLQFSFLHCDPFCTFLHLSNLSLPCRRGGVLLERVVPSLDALDNWSVIQMPLPWSLAASSPSLKAFSIWLILAPFALILIRIKIYPVRNSSACNMEPCEALSTLYIEHILSTFASLPMVTNTIFHGKLFDQRTWMYQ